MKDPRRYCDPTFSAHRVAPQQAAPHTSWLKNIFGENTSPSKKKKSIKNKAMPLPEPSSDESSVKATTGVSPTENAATVYTFGFGSDHDANLLTKISDAGNGMYYFVETEEKIGESFAHCLGGLASTVAQGIQMTVNVVDNGVTIKEVHTT